MSGSSLSGRSAAVSVVSDATMPQPMSTPTHDGMTAPRVGTTEPTEPTEPTPPPEKPKEEKPDTQPEEPRRRRQPSDGGRQPNSGDDKGGDSGDTDGGTRRGAQ